MRDLYSSTMRGILAEESLDKAGRLKFHPEANYFSADISKKLHIDEIDEVYIQQSKNMLTVFVAITAFENVTREFIYNILYEKHADLWFENGVQNNIKTKAESRKSTEQKVRYHNNRGDDMMSYVDFADLPKIITSQDNWLLFEPYVSNMDWVKNIFSQLELSRNVIMHSGQIDDFDIARVGMNIRDWLRQINA